MRVSFHIVHEFHETASRACVRVPSFLRVPARVALENTLLEHCQQYLRTVSDRAPLGESVISQW
jgi:hypothetical protein